ncbi:MAG: low temperature requirement protein A [Bacilli bacterium]|jgi:low temperature requirement protein LtrA|nr:low temperature requirement protein A [Bacilli bacterium]
MEERKVTWLELFFDLVFVVAIASTNHLLLSIEQTNSLVTLFKYFLMVIPLWWAWTGQTMFYNRFHKYLKYPIIFMGIQILAIIMMCASFNMNFEETYYTFMIGYGLSRFITIIEYRFVYHRSTNNKVLQVSNTLSYCLLLGLLVTLSSLIFNNELRYIIMYMGIFLDLLLPLLFHQRMKLVIVHIAHLAERLGLLVMITFGEAVVSIVSSLELHGFNHQQLIITVLSLLSLLLLFLSYYDDYDEIINKKHVGSGQLLLYGHLFIIMAIMIMACLINIGTKFNNNLLFYLIGLSSLITFVLFKNIIFDYYDYQKKKINIIRILSLIIIIILCGSIGLLISSYYYSYWLIMVCLVSFIDNRLLKKSRQS